MTSSIVSRL